MGELPNRGICVLGVLEGMMKANPCALNFSVCFAYCLQGFFLKIFFKLIFKERERNINVWLPLTWPPLWTWPTTQTCALTGNQTRNPLVHSPQSTELH